MGKYSGANEDVFSIFKSTDWVAESIKTFPSNFVASNVGSEYIRVTVLTSDSQVANPYKSVSGMVMIDIFTPAGGGPKAAYTIADRLDKYLAGETIKSGIEGQTQFGSSTLADKGIDKDNTSLNKYLYTISFNYFGV